MSERDSARLRWYAAVRAWTNAPVAGTGHARRRV